MSPSLSWLPRAAANRHGAQLFNRAELPCHPHLHHIQRRLQGASGLYCVLLGQLAQDLVEVQTRLRQPLLRNFNEHLFVLGAKQLNLGYIWYAQQLLAYIVSKGFDFGVVKAVRFNGVNHAIHIAKFIVEKRTLNAAGQRAANVTNLLAHGVPGIGHVSAFDHVLDLENNLRFTRLGIAANFVGVRHFLQRALQLVGHLFGHLLRRGTRPVSSHHHGPKGKGRVFILAELKVRGKAEQHQHQHQVARQRRMVQRPVGQVEFGRTSTRIVLQGCHGAYFATVAEGVASFTAAASFAPGLIAVCARVSWASVTFSW